MKTCLTIITKGLDNSQKDAIRASFGPCAFFEAKDLTTILTATMVPRHSVERLMIFCTIESKNWSLFHHA